MAQETPINDFGLLIAYVLPGFTAIWGTTYFSDAMRLWIGSSATDAPTVAGFLFITLASIGAGLTVSTIRWLIVDSIHHLTGIRPPSWDFSRLGPTVVAFGVLLDIHYRYYQAYSGMVISLIWLLLARRFATTGSVPLGWPDLAILALIGIFYLGSRDTLKKYYSRTGQLLQDRGIDRRI